MGSGILAIYESQGHKNQQIISWNAGRSAIITHISAIKTPTNAGRSAIITHSSAIKTLTYAGRAAIISYVLKYRRRTQYTTDINIQLLVISNWQINL